MTAPALTRAELQAAGRRKLEEFRRQKAAGKATASGAQGRQQQSSNGVPAAVPSPLPPVPPGVPPPHESTSGISAVISATPSISTQTEQPPSADPMPQGPMPPVMASRGQQPPQLPTSLPPQRFLPDLPASSSQAPLPRSSNGLDGSGLPWQAPLSTASGQPRHGAAEPAAASTSAAPARLPEPVSTTAPERTPGGESRESAGTADGARSTSSQGGLFGSLGGLFGSTQQAAADGGRPSWLAPLPSPGHEAPAAAAPVPPPAGAAALPPLPPASAAPHALQSMEQAQQAQQGAQQPVRPLPGSSSWASGYALLSDTYSSPRKVTPQQQPQSQQAGLSLSPPNTVARKGHSPSLSSSSLGDQAAAAAAGSAASLPAADGGAVPATSPAAANGGLTAATAQPTPSSGSAGGGGTAGATPRHSRQASDAVSAASSHLLDRGTGAASAAGGLPTSSSSSKFGPSATRAQEFKALQQHIDELTEEKFMLQRAVEHQSKLALSLAEENEAVTQRYNEQGAEVQSLRRQVEELRGHIAGQVAAVDAANAERDAYKLSAQEIQERSKALAAEVVALEEQVLRLKSSHLRDRSEASGASEVVRAMQAQLEAVSKERGSLLDEVHRLREDSAEARHQLKRVQQQLAAQQQQQEQQAEADGTLRQRSQAGSSAGAGDAGDADDAASPRGQGAAAAAAAAEQQVREARRLHAAELAKLEAELQLVQRHSAELQQRLRAAEGAAAVAGGVGAALGGRVAAATPAAAEASAARGSTGGMVDPTTAGAAARPSEPAASAAISAQALQEAAASAHAQEGLQGQGGLPPELTALLPASLYAAPTSDGSVNGLVNGQAALQLAGSIHMLLDALEQEKRQLVAALNAKQEELDKVQRTAALLEQRLAVQQRKLEVLAQQQAQQAQQPPSAVVATRA